MRWHESLPTLIRFGSLDELVATIKADIATADRVLETSPMCEFQNAQWLRPAAIGIGEAIFEALDPRQTLADLPKFEPSYDDDDDDA